ncbi:hypothetical protein TNCV_3199801 [Trichonephila clavipes]|nr:hypothetical protein TNCV_3199801 [Trichonephila clavipes]
MIRYPGAENRVWSDQEDHEERGIEGSKVASTLRPHSDSFNDMSRRGVKQLFHKQFPDTLQKQILNPSTFPCTPFNTGTSATASTVVPSQIDVECHRLAKEALLDIEVYEATGHSLCRYRSQPVSRKECESPYTAPVVLVPKSNGTVRLCIDYRKLNAITIPDKYPLSLMDVLLHDAKSTAFMPTLDLKSGYHKVAVNPADQDKTAFVCPFGTFRYKRMPFGLRNAPATFSASYGPVS